MSYHFLSKVTHWVSAIIILGLLFVGLYMTSLDFSDFKLQLYMNHKSFGLLVLLLLVLRILFLVVFKKPKGIETHKKWEKGLSHLVHVLLYGALLLMPLSGWVMSSAGDYTVQFFGIIFPDIVAKDEGLFEAAKEFHEILGFILIFAVLMHAAGAFKHHFIDKDITLKRMTSHSVGFIGGGVLVVLLGFWVLSISPFVLDEILEEASYEHVEVKAEDDVIKETAAIEADVRAWEIDKSDSFMRFESAQYGQSYSGEFEKFDGQIFFDPNALDQSRVRIAVDISSLETGSSDRDEQALSPVWFNEEQFPEAVFEADMFDHIEGERYVAKGTLSVRDVSLLFTLPFDLMIEGDEATMNAAFDINRLDYNVGLDQSEAANSNNVSFVVRVAAKSR